MASSCVARDLSDLRDFAGRGEQQNSSERGPPGQGSKASEKHKNDNNEQRETNAARGDITPFAAVRPAWQSSQQHQDQEDDQESSKHGLFLSKRIRLTKFKFPAPAAFLLHGRMARRAGLHSSI